MKYYVSTKEQIIAIEAATPKDAMIEVCKNISLDDLGLMLQCSTDPLGNRDDDVYFNTPACLLEAGRISEEVKDAMMGHAFAAIDAMEDE